MSVYTFSQITVTSSDFIGIGDVVLSSVDSTQLTSISPGSTGTNQSWDFSSLSEDYADTTLFTNPNWTPFGSNFPTSNLVMYDNMDDMYFYLEKSSTGLYGLGIAGVLIGTTPSILPFTPKKTLLEFPLNYLDSYTSVSTMIIRITGIIPNVDSMLINQNETVIHEVDAWGNVTIPLGTFNALRIYETTINIDSTWFLAMGNWSFIDATIDTTYSYAWYTNDNAAGFTLVQMDYEPSTGFVSYVSYLKATPTPTSISEQSNENSFNIYPNPASSKINFDMNNEENVYVDIYETTGKKVESRFLVNKNNSFDLSNYSEGIYFFNVREINGSIIQKGKFIVSR